MSTERTQAMAPPIAAPEHSAAPPPLIIVRQAPTGVAVAVLWLSGEEGCSANRAGLADDMESVGRGPDARRELEGLVRGWLAQHPGARIESEIELDLGRELEAAEKVAPPVPPADTPKSRYPDWLAPGKQVRRSDRDTDNTGTVVACHGQYTDVRWDHNGRVGQLVTYKLRPLEEAPGSEPQAAAAPAAPQGAGTFSAAFPVSRIRVEHNVRRHFDEEKLRELADSIRTVGILEPLVLRPLGDNPAADCALVAGERRLRAARLAGLAHVPAIIRPMTREQALELQVTENVQRVDLNPVEEAEAFATMVRELGWTQARIAERFGKSPAHVSEMLKLLEVRVPAVLQAIEEGRLSVRAAGTLHQLMPADPNVEPGGTAMEIGQLMVDQEWSAASAPTRLQSILLRHTRSLNPGCLDGPRPTFDISGCTGCPYRCEQKVNDWRGTRSEVRCLNPPCWNQKTRAVELDAQRKEEKRAAAAQEQRLAHARSAAEKAVQRVTKAAPAPAAQLPAPQAPAVDPPAADPVAAAAPPAPAALPDPGEIAGLAVEIHDLSRLITNEAWHISSEQKRKARARYTKILGQLHFGSEAELERWLGGGQVLAPRSLPMGRFAALLAEILAARAAGQSLENFTRVKAAAAQPKGKTAAPHLVAAPPLPDLTLMDKFRAEEWRELSRRIGKEVAKKHFWSTRESPAYARECYLPLPELIRHWGECRTLGATQMPRQMGHLIVWIQSPRIMIHAGEATHGTFALNSGTLRIETEHGHVECEEPVGLVYYRVQVSGGISGMYSLLQAIVLRAEFGELLIFGEGGATIRKDLVPKWWALMNKLPAFPTLEGEAADATQEQEGAVTSRA